MKIVAKCIDFVSLSYQVQVKVCNPIHLTCLFCLGMDLTGISGNYFNGGVKLISSAVNIRIF